MASHGLALVLTTARPSGAATTVSGPFSSTTAPAWAAAARAAAILSGDLAMRPGNTRSNSPACGVSTSSRSRIENRDSASSLNTVRASASTTSAAPVRASAIRFSTVALLTPAPGPITAASASPAARCRSASVSNPRTITASSWAALTDKAPIGESTVTSPAPIRSPPRAASRAAPVLGRLPLTTTSRPR